MSSVMAIPAFAQPAFGGGDVDQSTQSDQRESASPLATLSLEDAKAMALQHNYDLGLAGLAIQTAQAGEVIAAARPNPTLSLQTVNINPRMGYGAGDPTAKTVDSSVQLSQLIERGGKRQYRIESASLAEDAARGDFANTLSQLRVAVAQAYYDLLAAQQKEKVKEDFAQLANADVPAPAIPPSKSNAVNVNESRLQMNALQAESDVVEGRTDIYNAYQALDFLLGTTAITGSTQLTDDFPAVSQQHEWSFNHISPDALVEQRKDVRAARLHVDAAEAAYKLAHAAQTPDVTVGVAYEHYPLSSQNRLGSGNSYGVSAQIPLFVNYGFKGEAHTAEIAVETANENLAKVRALGLQDVLGRQRDIAEAYDRVNRYQNDLLVVAKKSLDTAEQAYKKGHSGDLDLQNARQTYQSTLLDAISAKNDYAKALVIWKTITDPDGLGDQSVQ